MIFPDPDNFFFFDASPIEIMNERTYLHGCVKKSNFKKRVVLISQFRYESSTLTYEFQQSIYAIWSFQLLLLTNRHPFYQTFLINQLIN